MNLKAVFKSGRTAFIPYVMAGDPDLETTDLLVKALSANGAGAIELGVPYSDPLADGPVIAAAGMRALHNGTAIADVLQLARTNPSVPIVLFTYYNPIYQFGIKRFAKETADAGVAGVIVPDLALEEEGNLREALTAVGVDMPLLVTPSTPRERAARIAESATGFVYVVSRLGVTGKKAPDLTPLRDQISMMRSLTKKPLAVGFGISSAEHVRSVRGTVDGVIVGSALIESVSGMRGEAAAQAAAAFARSLLS